MTQPRKTVKIALIYDFDGTLIPGAMQDPLLELLGEEPQEFWARVEAENKQNISEKMLIYLHHLADTLREKCPTKSERDALFAKAAAELEYFPGLCGGAEETSWFERIDEAPQSHRAQYQRSTRRQGGKIAAGI